MNGEKNGGTYEVDKFPVEQQSGLLNVVYTPSKGKNAGLRIAKQINIANIGEIEPVNSKGVSDFDIPEEE